MRKIFLLSLLLMSISCTTQGIEEIKEAETIKTKEIKFTEDIVKFKPERENEYVLNTYDGYYVNWRNLRDTIRVSSNTIKIDNYLYLLIEESEYKFLIEPIDAQDIDIDYISFERDKFKENLYGLYFERINLNTFDWRYYRKL